MWKNGLKKEDEETAEVIMKRLCREIKTLKLKVDRQGEAMEELIKELSYSDNAVLNYAYNVVGIDDEIVSDNYLLDQKHSHYTYIGPKVLKSKIRVKPNSRNN